MGAASFCSLERNSSSTRYPGSPALIFDWTILEAVDSVASQGKLPWPHTRPPIVVATSEKAEQEVPNIVEFCGKSS